MKVFVARMSAECNEHVSIHLGLDGFQMNEGDAAIDKMNIRDIFEEEGIEIIPALYANAHPGGMIEREAYDFFEEKILSCIRRHLHELDGIYLQFHGASGVLDLDAVSAEHEMLPKIRAIVGEYMPIAMIMDPHGNVTKALTDRLNIVRCFRESPHVDTVESQRIVARKLVELMKHRRPMKPILRKLPILIGGERSVSTEEPVKSINRMINRAEEDERVFSISWHVGYIRHDDDKLGAAIVVIPSYPEYQEYCEKIADEVSQFVWDHRREFTFTGNFDEPDRAVKKALDYPEKTVVVTDSGDNCGAGGSGFNTLMVKEFLKADLQDKRVLIAGVNDPKSYRMLLSKEVGDAVEFSLGMGETPESQPVSLRGHVFKKGKQYIGFGDSIVRDHDLGESVIVRVEGSSLDILVMSRNIQYGNMPQFSALGVDFHDYDVVVVKMGYLDTYLIPETAYHIMALTDGPTIQRSERIPYKRIARPMWPIDEFDKLYYIEK